MQHPGAELAAEPVRERGLAGTRRTVDAHEPDRAEPGRAPPDPGGQPIDPLNDQAVSPVVDLTVDRLGDHLVRHRARVSLRTRPAAR